MENEFLNISFTQKTSPLSISFETPVSEMQIPTIARDDYINKVKERFDVKVKLTFHQLGLDV